MARIIVTMISVVLFLNLINAQQFKDIDDLREKADSLHSIGQTEEAIKTGEEAIQLAEESGDPVEIVGTHAAQGVFLRSVGRIDQALESYDRAL